MESNRSVLKVCIWMNIPSHHQAALYDALMLRPEIDLRVCYFNLVSSTRAAEGWKDEHELKSFESHCEGAQTPEEMLADIPDWRDRIHIISANFNEELVEYFCEEGVRWCHWSEMPGIRLADLLGFRMPLFRLLNPLMLSMKQKEGFRIKKHALGALAQGTMAKRAFRMMGVPPAMCADLFYALAPLPITEPCREIMDFSNGRKVFLSMAALCPRKGITTLLRAFSALDAPDWCLVLCGLDKENGKNQARARSLGCAGRVLFLGARPSEQVAAVYAAADVFVLSSHFDGWGAVFNEAASAGLPIIGTDLCGGAWHAIHEGENGYRVKAGSMPELRKALQRYANYPGLLKPHGAASARIYVEELSPSVNAERLVRTLQKWSGHEG